MAEKLNLLKVSPKSSLLKVRGITRKVFQSDFSMIRTYALETIGNAPEEYKEKNLLEQQVSEMIKNAIEHGNRNNPKKQVKVWFNIDLKKKHVRLVVEDEGQGFKNLEHWNEFYKTRTRLIAEGDFEKMLDYVQYKTKDSGELDGGNALIAAVEYWNGGIVYNSKRNRVGLLRKF